VVDHREGSGLVVAADVVADPHRQARDAGFGPWGAFGDTDEGLDGGGDVAGRNDAARAESAVAHLDAAVVGGEQAASLVDGGMGVGVVTRGERAGEHLVATIGDRFIEFGEDGFGGVQQGERDVEHAVLELRIARLAERPPEREVTPQTAGRGRALDLLTDRSEGDGGYPLSLEDMGERTHGTRAQRSNRGEQHDVDTLIAQELGASWPGVHADSRQVELVAGIGKMLIGHAADHVALGQLVESVHREHGVHVVGESRPVEVGTPVAGHVVASAVVEDAVTRVHDREVVLVGMMQRRGRHDRDRRISKRWWCGERRCLKALAGERFGQGLDVGVRHEGETINSGTPPGGVHVSGRGSIASVVGVGME